MFARYFVHASVDVVVNFVFPSPFNRAGLGLNFGGPKVRATFFYRFPYSEFWWAGDCP